MNSVWLDYSVQYSHEVVINNVLTTTQLSCDIAVDRHMTATIFMKAQWRSSDFYPGHTFDSVRKTSLPNY